MSPKPWENAEGYADPTAYNAIKKVSAEGHEALDAKVNTLIKVLKFIIAESGFELAARIELRDLLRATLLVVTWPVWWLHEEVLGR